MKRLLTFTIRPQEGMWNVRGTIDGESLSPQALLSHIAFYDWESQFGLSIATTKEAIILSTAELLRLLDPAPLHFIAFEGSDDTTVQLLQAVHEAQRQLRTEEVWQSFTYRDGQFDFDISNEEARLLLRRYVTERLDVPSEEVGETVVSYLRTYGHTAFEPHNMPIHLALRLSEPETNDDDWLIETVIFNEKGGHWTPARSNVNAPIERALLKKWKPYAATIATLQRQMLTLTRSLSVEDVPHFFYGTMTERHVQQFLKEDIHLLKTFGFHVILPTWLRDLTETKVTVRGEAMTSYKKAASFDDIVAFNWQFAIGDQPIDREQFERIVEDNRQFIHIQDEWFHIDDVSLQKLKALIEEAESKKWTVRELLLEQQTVEEETRPPLFFDDGDNPVITFELNRQLRQFVRSFREKKEIPNVPIPPQLNATLRPYQVDGFNWLVFMRQYEFGACLADDMGLGKTIQLITYLLHIHQRQTLEPSLIICPTSVLGNWQNELAKFAPDLRVHVHYGQAREEERLRDVIEAERPHVMLTTYGTATQDGELLQEVTFSAIALDEAQNIKNMQTKQSRAIRALEADHYIALTGTPIENRLSELWAIFDFMFRGYFGSFQTFTKEYIIPIERDDDESLKQRLRTRIEPFLLRRTKNDPALELELPEKVEQNEFVPLTEEQAALYESYIQSSKQKMNDASAFERKGIVLGMLNKLKQLCNHPALYLKQPFDDASSLMKRSHKLNEIVKRSAQIAQQGEQCLIFTQYIGMGELIQRCLSELYDIDVPFLTGQMRKEERDGLVEAFQRGEFPIFILSLRAGGTGLNLTAANYVLHADRWWNPAVENQATDRAYRIGQTKFVHVTKYVTLGTIEEKIDTMLREKMSLSNDLIQSSRWITELSDDELERLFEF